MKNNKYKYMKAKILGVFLAIFAVFTSCETKPKLEQLQSDLDEKKIEMSNLKLEIKELQKEIEELDTTSKNNGIAVLLQELKYQKFEHFFEANGSFEATNYAYISPETSGQIKVIEVKEGSVVRKGQILAKLNTDIIESNIREIKTSLELATLLYEKQKELWDKNIGSELDYLQAKNNMERLQDQLKTLDSQLDMGILESPINGVVDRIDVKTGEMAMPGAMLMQVVDLNNFYLNVEVSESYIPFLSQGDPVRVHLMAYGDLFVDAKINRIANIINPENRSFEVRIKMKNTDNKIRPNMLAQVRFKDFEQDKAIVVPSILVKKDFNGDYLFVAKKSGDKMLSQKVYVETGKSIANSTHVVSGLKEGDKIIVQGYNQVVEGSILSVK
jgi:membrane fusion protein (multidrug efflux system)